VILKIYAFHLEYFNFTWNIFDFLIVIVSLAAFILEKVNLVGTLGNIKAISVFRTFRVIRILRLIKRANNLKLIF
jgi:hypothetical protein